jgi:hypothetical protein
MKKAHKLPKNKNGTPVLLAERGLTGFTPKRHVYTAEEQARAREIKTKSAKPQDDVGNVSRRSRHT